MNWGTDKRHLKLLNFSSCPNTLAEMQVLVFPDQQLYSTCWPGVRTVPHKMSICTLALLWLWLPWSKRKSLLCNSEIYWEWNTLTPGVPPVQAKQSHQLVLPTRKQKKWLSSLQKKKRQNGHDLVLEASAEQSRVSHHEADIFIQAWWNSFRGNLATCYSLCDTNILHYILRHFRYWTPLSRPSLAHRLITWFLYIYKMFKKQRISLHICLLKYPHALKRKKKRKWGLLVKSIILFHCGLQVRKTQVKTICEFSGKQIYKHYAMNIHQGEKKS